MEEKFENKPLLVKMTVLAILLVVVCGSAMLISTIKTQAVDGDMWREKAKSREWIYRTEAARRGTIFSSDGKVLATTVPVCDFYLDVSILPEVDTNKLKNPKLSEKDRKKLLKRNADIDSGYRVMYEVLGQHDPAKPASYYKALVDKEKKKAKPRRCMIMARRMPYSQWLKVKKLPYIGSCVPSKTMEGSVTSYIRAHIYGNLGENTIGLHYKTPNQEGYTGLEGYYDSVLRGQDGCYLCRRLTLGVWLPMEDAALPDEDSTLVQRRIDGKSIIATIDTRYQDIAESALRSSMNQFGGQRGCAILMEKETGYILACSSLTRDTSGRLSEMLWSNVACSDKYEPGSTFKVVAMTAMLNDKRIQLDTSKRVRAGGVKRYSNSSGEINDGHGYATDTTNLAGVLARSSNVGMCELAWEYYRTRRDDLKKGMETIFPFGKMNPDLQVREYTTRVVNLVSDRDFLNLSYGYSATVTPLQLITFYNAITNDGRMVKPLFCREILDGSSRSEIKPVVLNEHVCSKETAKQMREMLIGVVENGTGNNIYNAVYGIGGKTGTSLAHDDHSIKNSSFVGFFPADNPRYTCLVLVESTSIAGRHAAAPVFKKIADCVVAFDKELGSIRLQDSIESEAPVLAKGNQAQLRRVHQILGIPYTAIDSTASYWAVYDNERQGYCNYSLPKEGQVPNCVGMTVRDAIALLRSAGYKVRFSGHGKVVSQTPKSHTAAAKGTTIILKLANSDW